MGNIAVLRKLNIGVASAVAPSIQESFAVLISLLASAALLAAGEPAAAQAAQTSTAAPPATAKPQKEKMVCKEEPVTGTRFGKRVCRTEAEWRQMRQDAQNDTSRMQVQRDIR